MKRLRKDVARLLLAGLATGDGLGSTSEFKGLKGVADAYSEHGPAGWPYRQVGGGPFGWAPGQPTDDTDMAMCILRSACRNGGLFDLDAIANEFVTWLQTAPRDVGGTTRETLTARQRGAAWYDSGHSLFVKNPENSANGSLMRNGVVAAFAASTDDGFRITLQHAIVTHYDPLSVLCCCAQTYLIQQSLTAAAGARADLTDGWLAPFLSAMAGWLGRETDPAVRLWAERVGPERLNAAYSVLGAADFSEQFDPFDPRWKSIGAGYSLLTLQIAVWAWRWAILGRPYPRRPAHLPASLFERTGWSVIGWVALVGRDADTYGAVAGPLIAAALGPPPLSLIEGLTALAELDSLLEAVP